MAYEQWPELCSSVTLPPHFLQNNLDYKSCSFDNGTLLGECYSKYCLVLWGFGCCIQRGWNSFRILIFNGIATA